MANVMSFPLIVMILTSHVWTEALALILTDDDIGHFSPSNSMSGL